MTCLSRVRFGFGDALKDRKGKQRLAIVKDIRLFDCQQVSSSTPPISHEIQQPRKAHYNCQESEEQKDQSRSWIDLVYLGQLLISYFWQNSIQ
jgi:hypothetical protein